MVLIFSGHSNKSEQVLREVQLATDSHLPIVRFRIEDVALTDDLTYFLSSPHWLDALTPPLSKHIATLELAVKELLGQSAEDTASTRSATPLVESTQEKEREIVAEKASNRWKPLALAGVVISATVTALVLLRQPAQPGRHKPEAAPSPTPQPAQTSETTPSSTPRSAQTSETTPQPARTIETTPLAALPSSRPANVPIAPRSSNDIHQPSSMGPSPRNNRTWQTWIDDFVHQYVRSSESNDVDLATSFYAPTADLFGEGLKRLDSIRRDTAAYNALWPTRRATIRGDVQTREKVPDRGYAATFQADYYVENPARGKWVNVAVSMDLQIVISDGLPRITSLRQERLRKEEGMIQTR